MDLVPILETTLLVTVLIGAASVGLILGAMLIAAGGGGLRAPVDHAWPDVIARSEAIRNRMREHHRARVDPRPPSVPPEPYVPERPGRAPARLRARPHRKAA